MSTALRVCVLKVVGMSVCMAVNVSGCVYVGVICGCHLQVYKDVGVVCVVRA